MAVSPFLDSFKGEYEFSINETFNPIGVYTRRFSIEQGKTFGIVQMYEQSGSVPNRGGIFFITTDSDDCTAKSDSYIVSKVAVSGGGSGYSFNNVRPEAYNTDDDGFATKEVYGSGSLTNRYRINSMYIDTSTSELVIELEVFTIGNTDAKIHASFYTYKEAL